MRRYNDPAHLPMPMEPREQQDEDEAYERARERKDEAANEAPLLSASIAKIIISKSALHAWHAHPSLNPDYRSEESAEFDYGRAAHALLLEGDESKIAVIEADDWRKKDAKEARDAARAAGKSPMLPKQVARVRAMVKVAQAAIDASEIAEFWRGGESEHRIFWNHGRIACRSTLDRISADRKWIFDYKTAENAEPDSFIGAALRLGYDVQEAFYRMAVRAKYGITEPRFVFIVQEKEPPYAVSLVAFDGALQEMAERKVSYGAALWNAALTSGQWRGYPSRVCYSLPPAWYAAKAEALDNDLADRSNA